MSGKLWFLIWGLVIFLVIVSASVLRGQGVESEPNQPCQSAQPFGGITLSFAVEGALSPSPDVDFFSFDFVPGEVLRVDLEGSATGKGTLPDPYLGLFDPDCSLVSLDDDGGEGLNSRLYFTVPEDGHFTVGVTSCCDSSFTGGGEGSYLLTVADVELIGSIQGRVLSDEGLPLPGGDFPYAIVYLLRCQDYGCIGTGIGFFTDELGRFAFAGTSSDWYSLEAGNYALYVSAVGYTPLQTEPFYVGPGEVYEYGDVILHHIQMIGSISGQLVDSVSGEPISGTALLYAWVDLMSCDEWGNCYYILGNGVDDEGRFRFEGALYGLEVGNYKVRATASQYNWGETPIYFVDEGENLDVGDVPLTPNPLQLRLLQACRDLPTLGGTCKFAVEVRNASGQRITGQVWSQVWANLPSASTVFQIGKNGSTNPMPQKFNLKSGARTPVLFEFYVPPSFPDGWYACTATLVGTDPNPLFSPLGETVNFCILKGVNGYAVTSDKETRRLFRELRKNNRN